MTNMILGKKEHAKNAERFKMNLSEECKKITVIPAGQSAVKTGNDWWRIISQGARISKEYERSKRK